MSEKEVLFIRSSKKNLNESSGGGSSATEDDVWDDTILIKAYDKAVQLAQESYLKKKQSSENPGKAKKESQEKWKVGDKCRCQYSEDRRYYEADVIDIIDSTGMCVVKYIGYENEEKVPLKRLRPSQGESARSKQIEEALNENDTSQEMEVENDARSDPEKKPQGIHKKCFRKKKQQFEQGNVFGNAIIPPPPPPHMFNMPSESEAETEAMSAMLISWYMSGYHTGYYQGLKMAKRREPQKYEG